MNRLVIFLFLLFNLCAHHAQNKDSCSSFSDPEMKCIEEGSFLRGNNDPVKDEDSGKMVRDESPQAEIFLSTYAIDTKEVTYQQYQECVKAGGCSFAKPNYKGYDGPDMPMLGVNWYQADAYCKWKGKRLPTEAEWEKASRGSKGDLYPWGNEKADCQKAIIEEKGQKGCGTGKTHNVASRQAFRGLYDMAGNSWEWTQDWYSPNFEQCKEKCSGRDPKGPCDGKEPCKGYDKKVLKGGSWWWPAEYARSSNRRSQYPINKPFHHLGFRCAKSL